MQNKMKKALITIGILLATVFGFQADVPDKVVGGFSNMRGVTNLTRTSECSTYVIPEASSDSVDWGNGCVQHLTRQTDENLTISSFSNGERHGKLTLILLAASSNPGTITWPSAVKWASVSAPTLGAANRVDIINFYAVSSGSYYGVEVDRTAAQ